MDSTATLAPAAQSPGQTPPDPRLIEDWKRRVAGVPAPLAAMLQELVDAHGPALAGHFYDGLLADPRAARFLDPGQVQERLKPSLQRWARQLVRAGVDDTADLQQLHEHIGHVHARIGIPVDLVGRGMRMLKEVLYAAIRQRAGDDALALEACVHAGGLFDLALESMTRSYARSREAAGELDGSFRLFSLIQNVGTERERQRALLLAWENALLYALTAEQPGPVENLLVSRSEFGLWFLHKGLASFGETTETRQVGELAERIDAALRERLPAAADAGARRALLEDIRGWTGEIRNLVAILFEGIGDLESGRDALTRLLNRRFLPTILRREVALQANTGRQFAVLMLDLDHFKSINDNHGHEAGDRALQHVASILVENTRGSDYLFRYGGEEFVVVLGSVSQTEAVAIAHALRRAIADAPLALPGGDRLQLTASIGVAVQDGHPDYERVLARADAAMYQAKRSGRDRVVVADGPLPDPPGHRAQRG
ncbi:diguanylate cyclase [Pseudoxanthomonas suwonensis]|uniref:diguanylate cyclase n=1 Tax=Pseudoxanthomonas suwonensis TaxID=314722 RepID=UPI000466D2E4|nr:diguanylate cyclase [Pseudoxanthomonas suwonensis]